MLRIEDCREAKDFCEVDSEDWLRETVISTIEPEVMEGGRRIEGNSICNLNGESVKGQGARRFKSDPSGAYKTLILCKENGDASINFADGQRD